MNRGASPDLGPWLEHCDICEHRCGVDRRYQPGVCGLSAQARFYRAFLHWGEEPEITPTLAVFVTGCSFRCTYCSDGRWVDAPEGGELVVPEELAARIDDAWRDRPAARSVSFVGGNPDESMVELISVISRLRTPVPVVWNSNLYLTERALEALLPSVDVFVPDLKFGNDRCAEEVGQVGRYTEVLQRNLVLVHGRRRLIVRHLLTPGHLDCCLRPVVDFIRERLPEATLNLMTQYEPRFAVWPLPEGLDRRPTAREVEKAREMIRGGEENRVWLDGQPWDTVGNVR